MKAYWFTFLPLSYPTPLNLGAGVTAQTEADARAMLSAAFPEAVVGHVRTVDDVATLEQNHVAPNMGNILVRGIWFPLGNYS